MDNLTFEEFKNLSTLTDVLPTNIALILTNSCNLACRYCFVHQNPQSMSLETAKKGVDFCYNNFQQNRQFNRLMPDTKAHILFFGGEPLLFYKNIIIPTVEYCNNIYTNNFKYDITTNGTLLTKEVIDFLEQNNFDILISFDGIAEIQNINRPFHSNQKTSFEVITANIENNLKPSQLNYELRATADLDNINLWFDNFVFFDSLNAPFIWVIEFYKEINQQQKQLMHEQITKICDYIFNKIEYNNSICLFENFTRCLNLIVQGLKNQLLDINAKNYVNLVNFCGINIQHVTITPDGSFYLCHQAKSNTSVLPTKIGDLDNGFDYQHIMKLRESIQQIEYDFLFKRKCQNNCWFINHNIDCQYEACPQHVLELQDIEKGVCTFKSLFCEEITKHLVELVEIKQNQFFINFLRKNVDDFEFIYQYMNAPKQLQQIIIEKTKQHIEN